MLRHYKGKRNGRHFGDRGAAMRRPMCTKTENLCSGGAENEFSVIGDLGEAVGADDGGDGDHGVVAEMEEETGEDGAGVCACKGEDDTDQNQQANDAPS